jgi:cytidylate kinase
MSRKRKPIIAIDGPAGSGKSTLAKALARRLGLLYIDTGAMYRAVTYEALRRGVDFQAEGQDEALSAVAHSMKIRLEYDETGTKVFIDGSPKALVNEIRTPEISRLTSQITANVRGVREALVSHQWEMGKDGGVVMEGRDIGTVVFPDADLKLYFEVSVDERTRRRIKDFQDRGIDFDEGAVRADIERRDVEDMGRTWGALKKTEDSVFIQGDGKSVEDLVAEILPRVLPQKNLPAYNFARFFFGTLLRIFARFEIRDRRAVPMVGPLILISNHESYIDPVAVGVASPRVPTRFMARASLWDSKLLAIYNDAVGAFPVKRGGADRQAWRRFEELVKGGAQVCFFPEGTRSPDGKLQPPNPGAGMLIHRCQGATILPVRVFGTHKVLHKDKGFQGFHQIRVAFGKPVDLSAEWAKPGSREVYQVIAEKMMAGIAAIEWNNSPNTD